MRKGKKKLAQMMAAVLTATTLLQTPVSVFADPVVKEQVEKKLRRGFRNHTGAGGRERGRKKRDLRRREKEDSKEGCRRRSGSE